MPGWQERPAPLRPPRLRLPRIHWLVRTGARRAEYGVGRRRPGRAAPSRRRRRQRQGKDKSRTALVAAVFQPQLATVRLDETTSDGQTQACARRTCAAALEWPEEPLSIGRRNTRASVQDLNANCAVLALSTRHHTGPWRGVDHGILEQIGNHLIDLRVVARHRRKLIRNLESHPPPRSEEHTPEL